MQLLTLAAIRFYCAAQNKKKAMKRSEETYAALKNQEFLDLTDRENLEFEYIL